MKAILIATLAAIAFTHAAGARTWTWFHGDIGIASPFAAPSEHRTTVTQQRTAKKKAVQKRALAKTKISSADKRIATR
jgi:hypothetical protein